MGFLNFEVVEFPRIYRKHLEHGLGRYATFWFIFQFERLVFRLVKAAEEQLASH